LNPVEDQSFPAGFVKGFAGIAAAPAPSRRHFLTEALEKSSAHGLVACEMPWIMACLVTQVAFL
jgi:hypothetical protein